MPGLIPQAKREAILLHKRSAFRTFIRPVPGADMMQWRDGAGGLEAQPWSRAAGRQPI